MTSTPAPTVLLPKDLRGGYSNDFLQSLPEEKLYKAGTILGGNEPESPRGGDRGFEKDLRFSARHLSW